MDPNQITYFGETDARNKKIRFGIKAKDRLRHMYVIGKTGMGKSTLLENMAIQDMQNGNGLAVIDPHGSMAEKLLDYVPEHRIKDVLYFAPFDLEYPVSFNVLEDIGVDKRHLVVNGLMSTFEKIWVDAWSARMAYILNNTLLALLEYPGATLLGVNRVLSDKAFRQKVVDNVKDPSVKAFWIEEFGKYTERFAAEATPAIQNKVGQFTSNAIVRNMIGQSQSSFDIRKFMDEKKILIVNLSKGKVGEGNANLIGSMLITKIYLAAMSRADSSEQELAKLPNFYLYVDEFQSFANKSFADILSEARKYKLNLTIAHQYIEQMEEEVRDAVFGNVGTMICFRVGAFDAEVLEKEFSPTFMANDLVNLGFAQVYLKLMIDGVSSQPFSSTTMGPITRPEISFKNQVIKSSREQYARPRAEVEKGIIDWHDAGTTREVKIQGNSSFKPMTESRPEIRQEMRTEQRQEPRREVPRQEAPKIDENKIVFAKAAEELRQKERFVPSTPPELSRGHKSSEAQAATVHKKPVQDEHSAKKTPSKENVSSLKSALAEVIKKEAPKEIPKEPNRESEKKQENVHNSHAQPERSVGNKSAEAKAPTEVPEDVLKNLLKVDPAK